MHAAESRASKTRVGWGVVQVPWLSDSPHASHLLLLNRVERKTLAEGPRFPAAACDAALLLRFKGCVMGRRAHARPT